MKQAHLEGFDRVESSDSGDLSFAAREIKTARMKVSFDAGYIGTSFLLPTTNICERLFSVSGNALNNNHRNVLPTNLEQKIFSHMNSNLWGVQDVDAIVDL